MNNKASLLERIKAFFIKLITVIYSFFYHLFHINKKDEKKQDIKVTTITKEGVNKVNPNSSTTPLPDEPNAFTNPHNEGDEEAPNDVILVLPKTKMETLKIKTVGTKKFVITKELIEELIEKAIEEIEEYKKIDFKVKDADKQTKEVIKEFKEKVIPKINHEIERNKPENPKELMNIVTEVVKEQNKLTPIIPKKEEKKEIKKEEPKKDKVIELDINNDKKPDLSLKVDNKKKEPYFMATIIPTNTINLKTPAPVKTETKVAKTVPKVKDEIKDKADDVPIRMVKNTPDPLRPSLKDEVKTVAAVAAVTIVKAAAEILSSTPKENKNKIKAVNKKAEEKQEEIKVEQPKPKQEEPKKEESKIEQPEEIKVKELDIPELKQIDEKIKESDKPKEMALVTEELEYIDKKIDEKELEIKKAEEKKEEKKKEQIKEEVKEEIKEEITPIIEEVKVEEKPKEPPKKEFIDDSIIDNISEDISKTTTKANEEMKKEDIEDKNYKDVERDLDKILKDIEDTKYKFKDTIPEIQLRKLEAQKAKIEQTRYSIDAQKKIDINNEKKHLEEIIQESEKEGLKQEIDKLNIKHRLELNNELMKKTDKINNLSEEQLAVIEKNIIKRRLREAYRHATITSMIAFPFIRTRFFLFFTAGMMVKTFFLQIGHILSRRKDELSLPDINALKNGENALNEAINITDENLNTLDYLTMEALNKYPELQYDREFIRYVNGLKSKLNQNYQKLTTKRSILDKTIHRSKKGIKTLKKDIRKDLDRAA